MVLSIILRFEAYRIPVARVSCIKRKSFETETVNMSNSGSKGIVYLKENLWFETVNGHG